MENFERTLVVIKPDGMKYKDEIVRRIRDAGFVILQTRIVQLTPEQASEFYRFQRKHPCYRLWIAALTEGPVQAMCVSKINAISDLLWLIGPEGNQDGKQDASNSLRNLFANDSKEMENVIHGSEDETSATFEINFFFPMLLFEPIFKDESLNSYLSSTVNPVLIPGLYAIAKERPKDPIIWFANWLLSNNPYRPKISSSTSEDLFDVGQRIEPDEHILKNVDCIPSTECDCENDNFDGICPCAYSVVPEI